MSATKKREKFKKGDVVFFTTLNPYIVDGYSRMIYFDYPETTGRICRLKRKDRLYFDYIHQDFLQTKGEVLE